MFNYSHLILKPYIVLSTSRLSDLCHEPRSLLKHSLILQVPFKSQFPTFYNLDINTLLRYFSALLHACRHLQECRCSPAGPSTSCAFQINYNLPNLSRRKKYKQHGLTNSHVPFFQISNRPRSSKIQYYQFTETFYQTNCLPCPTHASISRYAVEVLQVQTPLVYPRLTPNYPTCRDVIKTIHTTTLCLSLKVPGKPKFLVPSHVPPLKQTTFVQSLEP